MKIRRKKLDVIFSKLVRERANYTCQACCVNKRHEPGTLDCAHIMSRRSVSLRWHPKNAVALCRGCHMFYTDHPFDWNDWCIDNLGSDLVSELRIIANKPVKWTKRDREDIYLHYQDQFKKMVRTDNLIMEFEQHELMHKFGSSVA